MSQTHKLSSLKGKIFITGQIEARTALHIGGSKDGIDIGGVDLNVIKNHLDEPFIPGSSLKGKLRAMLARLEGTTQADRRPTDDPKLRTDQDIPYLATIFGIAANENKPQINAEGKLTAAEKQRQEPTRLLVRDAPLCTATAPNQKDFSNMDFKYTDVKFENSIDRRRGVAQHPRQLERVPAGAAFEFELVLDVYDKDLEPYVSNDNERIKLDTTVKARDQYLRAILTAMQLLQDDYLGGHGSRGYGKIAFNVTDFQYKEITNLTYGTADLDEDLEALKSAFEQLYQPVEG